MSRACIICGKDEGRTHKYDGGMALGINRRGMIMLHLCLKNMARLCGLDLYISPRPSIIVLSQAR
jgi:hypothetical protein